MSGQIGSSSLREDVFPPPSVALSTSLPSENDENRNEEEEEEEFALLVRRKRRIGRAHPPAEGENSEPVTPIKHAPKRMRLKRARISTSDDEDDVVLASDDEIEVEKDSSTVTVSKEDWFAPLGSDDDVMETLDVSEDDEMEICENNEEPERHFSVSHEESVEHEPHR